MCQVGERVGGVCATGADAIGVRSGRVSIGGVSVGWAWRVVFGTRVCVWAVVMVGAGPRARLVFFSGVRTARGGC